jgi:uncharacterized membrane protein
MTEFTTGIWNTFRAIAGTSSVALALIFFCGHVLIAMTVVSVMTGASLWEAGAVAIVEPAINSVWFYVLHKIWASTRKKS